MSDGSNILESGFRVKFFSEYFIKEYCFFFLLPWIPYYGLISFEKNSIRRFWWKGNKKKKMLISIHEPISKIVSATNSFLVESFTAYKFTNKFDFIIWPHPSELSERIFSLFFRIPNFSSSYMENYASHTSVMSHTYFHFRKILQIFSFSVHFLWTCIAVKFCCSK